MVSCQSITSCLAQHVDMLWVMLDGAQERQALRGTAGTGTAESSLQQGSGWAGFLPVQYRLSKSVCFALRYKPPPPFLWSLRAARQQLLFFLPAEGPELWCTKAVTVLLMVCPCWQPLSVARGVGRGRTGTRPGYMLYSFDVLIALCV